MTASILYSNVALHLNHEKCVGNESHTAPIKHTGVCGGGDLERKSKQRVVGGWREENKGEEAVRDRKEGGSEGGEREGTREEEEKKWRRGWKDRRGRGWGGIQTRRRRTGIDITGTANGTAYIKHIQIVYTERGEAKE